jgi:isochorismate pyruvate lyase
MNEFNFSSLDEIRTNIDNIDKEIVILLSRRGECVKHAARFKTTAAQVRDPQRLEQIIEKVTSHAKEIGFDSLTTEIIYRNMIEAFIQLEMKTYSELGESNII